MRCNFRKGFLAVAVVASLGMSAAHAGGRPDLVDQELRAGRAHVPNEMLVKFRDDASRTDVSAVFGGLGAQPVELVRGGPRGSGDLVRLRLPAGVTVASAVRALQDDAAVEYAEPNWIYSHSASSNDPYFTNGSLWGMYGSGTSPANQFGSHAASAWAAGHTSCGNVVVGVIDEGIMTQHVDLAANIWANPHDAGDGVDNDGNGYADDIHGWNFVDDNNQVYSAGADAHGTHVAGTIGGVGGNGTGVAGVCWSGVKIVSGKFLGKRGGTTANAIRAVDYMTDLKLRHSLNLVATNNSWGGGGFSQALQDAITRAGDADILFIAAAGNSGTDNDASPSYPASYSNANVIAVASITSGGALSSFSQYGATSVDICAPGSGIWSTVPVRQKGAWLSGYASYNGTSMATPHVTGAVALYKSARPGATAADVKAAILGSATPTASCNGKVSSNGRLDVTGF